MEIRKREFGVISGGVSHETRKRRGALVASIKTKTIDEILADLYEGDKGELAADLLTYDRSGGSMFCEFCINSNSDQGSLTKVLDFISTFQNENPNIQPKHKICNVLSLGDPRSKSTLCKLCKGVGNVFSTKYINTLKAIVECVFKTEAPDIEMLLAAPLANLPKDSSTFLQYLKDTPEAHEILDIILQKSDPQMIRYALMNEDPTTPNKNYLDAALEKPTEKNRAFLTKIEKWASANKQDDIKEMLAVYGNNLDNRQHVELEIDRSSTLYKFSELLAEIARAFGFVDVTPEGVYSGFIREQKKTREEVSKPETQARGWGRE